MKNLLEKEVYDKLDILGEDQDFLDQLEEKVYEFEDVEFNTIIHSMIEDFVPISDSILWSNARMIEEYVFDTLGRAEFEGTYCMEDVLINGHILYYERLILGESNIEPNNLNKIIYNCAIDYLQNVVEDLSLEISDYIDLEKEIRNAIVGIRATGINKKASDIQKNIDRLVSSL